MRKRKKRCLMCIIMQQFDTLCGILSFYIQYTSTDNSQLRNHSYFCPCYTKSVRSINLEVTGYLEFICVFSKAPI